MNIKKISLLLTFVFIVLVLFGCGKNEQKQVNKENITDKISIVVTEFAPYDLTRQIVGDKAELTMLLDPGVESHSYEPTPQDIIKIQNCDVFVYVGGETDTWVTKVLASIENDHLSIVRLMDCVELYEEEMIEGMQEEEEELPADGATEEAEEIEYDEHIWTSPQNAIKMIKEIEKAVTFIDSKNHTIYEENATDYQTKLKELDAAFHEVVESAKRKEIIFGDRFPLRYFVEEYGLTYYAAFPGCATETEPSSATITFLIDKVKSDKIPVVFHIELSNEQMADTICEATGAKKRLFHACHNVSKKEFDQGVTYLKLMQGNLEVLKEALN